MSGNGHATLVDSHLFTSDEQKALGDLWPVVVGSD
jgi:hypothetical protein